VVSPIIVAMNASGAPSHPPSREICLRTRNMPISQFHSSCCRGYSFQFVAKPSVINRLQIPFAFLCNEKTISNIYRSVRSVIKYRLAFRLFFDQPSVFQPFQEVLPFRSVEEVVRVLFSTCNLLEGHVLISIQNS
jgi:hypothetical protein